MNRTKRTLLSAALLVAPAAVAEPPSARFPGDGFELRVYQDAEQAIPPSIFSIPGDGRHPDPPPGGAFRSSCNVFLVIEGDRRVTPPRSPTSFSRTSTATTSAGSSARTAPRPSRTRRSTRSSRPAPTPRRSVQTSTGCAPSPIPPLRPTSPRASSPSPAPATRPATSSGPGHTPCHVFYRKGTLLFVGDAFHAVDLQIFVPEYCAKWDQEPATAVATRRALIQRSYTNIPKPKPNRITPLSSPPIDHPPLFLCGAHIPFPGIVSKIHLPMASAHEAPSFDTPAPGTPIPAEPRPPEPPEPLVEIRRRAEPAGVEAAPPPSVAFPAGPSGE